jgi:site-specific DNA-cytosine methylase
MQKEVYVIDLFCGCGGFSTGAQQAGAKVILAVDCWKEALMVHEANHPETEHLCTTLGGDMDEFASFLTGFIDLNVPSGSHVHLHASPPCQEISKANPNRNAQMGMKLVNWSLELVTRVNPTTWTLEQVCHPQINSLISTHGGMVVQMDKLGIPTTRKRVVMGNYCFERLNAYECSKRVSMQDVLHKLKFTPPVGVNAQSNGSQPCKAFYRSLDCPSYTITGHHPSFYDTTAKRGYTIPLQVVEALHAFPNGYASNLSGSMRQKDLRKMVANSVPPLLSYLILQHIQAYPVP